MSYANATALTVKSVPQGGRDISTMQNPDGTNGNKFAANEKTLLRVKNTGTQKTLTIETPGTVKGWRFLIRSSQSRRRPATCSCPCCRNTPAWREVHVIRHGNGRHGDVYQPAQPSQQS
jgi:hypothetical protein